MEENEFNSHKISKALYKKALGYEVNETVEEYATDDADNLKLVKKKITTKNVPPDIQSAKVLLELLNAKMENDFENYSDEELEMEKQKLLELLQNSQEKEQKTDEN